MAKSLSLKDAATILGISQSASQKEIVKAFKQFAKIYHPDKDPSPQAKKKYDRYRNAYDVMITYRTLSRAAAELEEEVIDHEFERWIRLLPKERQLQIREELKKLNSMD